MQFFKPERVISEAYMQQLMKWKFISRAEKSNTLQTEWWFLKTKQTQTKTLTKACNFDNKHHINNQIKSPFQAILAYKTVSNLWFYRAKHQTEQSAKIVTDVVWSVCVSLCESVSVSVGKNYIPYNNRWTNPDVQSYCSLFAARLSRYTSAYSLVARYCSESSRHR